MPKKTKDANDVIEVTKANKTKSSKTTSSTSKGKTTSTKKATSSKKVSTKNSELLSDVDNISDRKRTKSAKKVVSKDIISNEETSTTKKTSSKKASTTKKTSSTKSESTKKKNATKKGTTKKKTSTRKKVNKKRVITSKRTANLTNTKSKKANVIEYYDLPYRYNETTVKVLAQTPKTLFVYWDISDEDRKKLVEKYSDNFFEVTYPVLIVHNETKNYSFEVRINDFANSWYLSINDENCKYILELGRRFIENSSKYNNSDNYVYIATSNYMDAPNNRILINRILKEVIVFRNVKTGKTYFKNIENTPIMNKLKELYNIYTEMYKDTVISNPASESLSSRFM